MVGVAKKWRVYQNIAQPPASPPPRPAPPPLPIMRSEKDFCFHEKELGVNVVDWLL